MSIELHIDRAGRGDTALVFCHGFGGSARNWRPQLKHWSESYKVAAFDARGHARSAAPSAPEAYERECFIADLARVVDEISADKTVVVGLSMGAGVALSLALAHPERVSALVLAAFPSSRDSEKHVEWATGFADAIDAQGLEQAGAQFVWGGGRFDARAQSLIRAGFMEHSPHALASILRRLIATQPAPEELAPGLRELDIPTLVLVGSEDHRSLEQSRRLHALAPDVALEIVEGGGHVFNLTHAEAFNTALSALVPV